METDQSNGAYKLWFEYARRSNPSAWRQKVIDVFGDVREVEFVDWWKTRNKYFVGPQQVPLVVIEDLNDYIQQGPGEFPELRELVVMCNTNLPKRTLMEAFSDLLDRELEKKQGAPKFDDLGDLFKLEARPDTNALKVRLDVFDAREKGLSYVDIADSLKLIDRKTELWKSSNPEALKRQKATKQSTVSRYLREFDALIKNVELGVFPAK